MSEPRFVEGVVRGRVRFTTIRELLVLALALLAGCQSSTEPEKRALERAASAPSVATLGPKNETTPWASTWARVKAKTHWSNPVGLREHLVKHVKYPSTKADLVSACHDMADVAEADKQKFKKKLPDKTYKSPDEVMMALAEN